MREDNETNGAESEELDMDRLMKEIDELVERTQSRKEAKAPKAPLPAPSSEAEETARACGILKEPGAPPITGPLEKREHGDEAEAEVTSPHPVYDVFILPADTQQITSQDLERLVPLEITDEKDIPACLAELQPGETLLTRASDGCTPKHAAAPVPKKKKRPVSFGDIAFYLVLIAVVVAVFFFAGDKSGPKSFAGYSAFTVLSGSMESEIPKGSLVITKQVDPSQLQIGDDITYLSNPTTTITHRIVGIMENYADTGERAFTTQGVMNSTPDKQPVAAVNVVGKVIYHSLTLGKAASFLKEHWLLLLVLTVLLFSLIHALKVALGKDDTDAEKCIEKPVRKRNRKGAIHSRGETT